MNDRLRSLPRQPAEGWISLVLVFVMAGCLAWSISDARWVIGRGDLTSFLPFAAAGGVAWGFISAKAGWSRWQAHLLGAVFAGLLLPIMVGGVLLLGDFTPGPAFVATASSTIEAYLDLAFRGMAFTQEYGHFMLILGIMCWANGQFTSYAVFGHHRPLNAVIMSGIALVLNMSLTLDEQLGILIWFSLAALFLLVRLHALDERSTWLRHRLGDAGSLSNFYLRGGAAFITVAVVGALILTSTAASAPLASLWRGVDQRLVELTHGLEAVFRGGGSGTRISPVDFLSSTRITGEWVTDETPVLSIKVPDGGDYHWRAVAYDNFDGQGWTMTNPQNADVAAGKALVTDSLDDPASQLDRKSLTFEVSEINYDPAAIFTPDHADQGLGGYLGGLPGDVTQPVRGLRHEVRRQRLHGHRRGARLRDRRGRCRRSRRPDREQAAGCRQRLSGRGPGLLPPARSDRRGQGPRHAGPAGLDQGGPSRCQGTRTTSARRSRPTSRARAASTTRPTCPRSTAVATGSSSASPRTKIGYCEYYASTMVVLLRMQGIPARFVEGFLPTKPDANGVELISQERRPRLGRGLLPELRLDHLRSDRRRRRPGPGDPQRAQGHAPAHDQRGAGRLDRPRRHRPAADAERRR